jgi:hypothetical protein
MGHRSGRAPLVLTILIGSVCAAVRSRSDLVLENLALRQQLATYAQGRKRPMLGLGDRALRDVVSIERGLASALACSWSSPAL